jgi:hypothetical protein
MDRKLFTIDAPSEHADAIFERLKLEVARFPGAKLASSKDWLAALREDEGLPVEIGNQEVTDGPDD